MSIYERHTPATTLLHKIVARQWPGIVRDYACREERIAPHVLSEFERFQRCGIIQYGFLRLECPVCLEERVVGFSCKARGFCNRCGSRRMEQTANRLDSDVWPEADASSPSPARQTRMGFDISHASAAVACLRRRIT